MSRGKSTDFLINCLPQPDRNQIEGELFPPGDGTRSWKVGDLLDSRDPAEILLLKTFREFNCDRILQALARECWRIARRVIEGLLSVSPD